MDLHLCEMFIEHLQKVRVQHQFALWAFVIMPSHIHLLIRPEAGTSISKLLHSVKRFFSYRALKYIQDTDIGLYSKLKPDLRASRATQTIRPLMKHDLKASRATQTTGMNLTGRFWQHGGGYDRNIVSVKALTQTIDYIHNNPVRAGLVKDSSQWKWSSANYWVNRIAEPLEMDSIDIF